MTLLANFWVDGTIGLALGVATAWVAAGVVLRRKRQALDRAGGAVMDQARRDAENLTRDARLAANDEARALRLQTEQSFAERQRDLSEAERRLGDREELVNRQLHGLVDQEKSLQERHRELTRLQGELEAATAEVNALRQRARDDLERLAHLSSADARTLLLKRIEEETQHDAAELVRQSVEEAKNRAEASARKILCVALQRYAGVFTAESTTATVALQGEDIKGRIIGREGRNIRAFEAVTGVTVLIDDTPNAVVLSGFDPVRREIARESMQRLVTDGRIHPTRIEEVVAQVTSEVDEAILRCGEEAVVKVGLPPLPTEVVRLLGRLKFRRSFAQNLLDHSIEVAHLTGLLAAEVGVDVPQAKRAGLLHDIGKALHQEVEGSHAIVGADFVRRHGISEEVTNGVASHHGEVPATNVLGSLVAAADAISAARPGARLETMATYVRRVESLEKIGLSFPGVDKCFAVQAGRELRVLVQPEQVSDDQALLLARSIVRRIEDDLQYPGQIRVTVVRETRCVEFAK